MNSISGIKSVTFSLNSTIIKKYLVFIISIIFLFSVLSSLFVPALTAKDVVSGKEAEVKGSFSNPSVDKTESTPAASVVGDDAEDEDDDDVEEKDTGVSSNPSVDKTESTPAASVVGDDDDSDDVQGEEKNTGVSSSPAVEKTVDTPASLVIPPDSPANENANENSFSNIESKTILKFDEEVVVGENNTIKYLKSNIGNISADQTFSVTINEPQDEQGSSSSAKTKIEVVEFKAASSQENVELSVKNLKEKPAEVKTNMTVNNDSEIYEYLDIKLTSGETYIGETGIKSMNFTFTVSKSWIQSKGIDKQTVKMMRYHNDTWQVLNTTYLNETDDEMKFKAETPGLSIFAVVGNKVVEDSDEIVVEAANIPWWMPFTVILASTATLGVVLFKKRFVYNP